MGLDITLTLPGSDEPEYSTNITHNLARMADAANIYPILWEVGEDEDIRAETVYPLLQEGLSEMILYPETYEIFNATNGWGTYDNFVPWLFELIQACRKYPTAIFTSSR